MELYKDNKGHKNFFFSLHVNTHEHPENACLDSKNRNECQQDNASCLTLNYILKSTTENSSKHKTDRPHSDTQNNTQQLLKEMLSYLFSSVSIFCPLFNFLLYEFTLLL